MLSSKMQINKKLLAIKGHFFFFNAGTAPLVPYLSTYARQLGFSSATVGLIYTILPIFGLIAKPLFGIIADRFKKQKVIFILFQLITILSFWAIYFVPDNRSLNVELDCNDGVTVLQSCFQSSDEIDTCKVDMLSKLNSTQTTSCQMNCNMTSNDMWQTVCEHWQIPQYCYSNTRQIQYTSSLGLGSMGADNCLHIAVNNVSMDGQWYTPHCRLDDDSADLDEPCALKCNSSQLTSALINEKAYMTCREKMLNYKLCTNNTSLLNLTKEANNHCEATCDLDTDKPQRLMEICDWWKADAASYCKPKTTHEVHLNSSFTEIVPFELPKNLSFTGIVLLSSTMAEHNCVYMRLKHIELPNQNGIVTTHVPNCDPVSATQFFESACDIRCEDTTVNEIIESATDSRGEQKEYTSQFGIFFLFMILSWIGQAVVVTFADAICFNMLGPKVSSYGKQRLWGSFGWGIFSLLTGVLIDVFSDGAYKDYTVAFVLMFVFMLGDVGVSCFLETDSTKMSMNILADVGSLLSSLPTFMFMLWTIAVGMCTGLLWNFLFWLIEDVLSCEGSGYTKTLQGLVSATQTFGGEIPCLFISGYVLKKFGHENMMSLVLFAFGVRFILYSFLDNAWWVLPIELLQGITFGMFYPTMTSYATIVSPPGTETTVQGLVGAVFEGVGTSLGSFIGGRLYKTYGGFLTFRSFGIGAIICSVLNWSAYFFFKDKLRNMSAGYSSVIRYEQPNDMIYMLEDINEGKL